MRSHKSFSHSYNCTVALFLTVALVSATALRVHADDAPAVVRVDISTLDAPELKTTNHGRIGQNVEIDRHMTLSGADGDNLFGFCHALREEGAAPEHTPAFFRINLANGELSEYFYGGRDAVQAEGMQLDDPRSLLDGGPRPKMTVRGWMWDQPVSIAAGRESNVYVADSSGNIILLDTSKDTFEDALRLPGRTPSAMSVGADGFLYALTETGALFRCDTLGSSKIGDAPLPDGRIVGIAPGDEGDFLTALGPAPYRFYRIAGRGEDMTARPMDAGAEIVESTYHGQRAGGWFVVKTAEGAKMYLKLEGGELVASDQSPAGYELDVDFRDSLPITVREPGKEPRSYPLVFSRAAWDRTKSITIGPDGHKVYGGGWPTAWIWEFDPDSGRIRRHGRDYVWYEMLPAHGQIYAIGYWGIKLMSWDPAEPWIFNYSDHYQSKQPWPANQSPWGARDSNPRLVCKFRYMHNLNVRRPSGFALGADGRLYAGSKNPAKMFYLKRSPQSVEGYRYSSALCWYDPATETIGQEREPFLHYEAMDITSVADGRYIAIADRAAPNPFEPRPEPFIGRRLVIFDTQTREFVYIGEPPSGTARYVAEGWPGHVVGVAHAAGLGGEGINTIIYVFDTETMSFIHAVGIPPGIRWNVYDHSGKIERGPDNWVYFYAGDEHGTAMFRFDSVTGAIEPVFRENGVTNFTVYQTPGAAFCFGDDRIYFGTHSLHSLTFDEITAAREARRE